MRTWWRDAVRFKALKVCVVERMAMAEAQGRKWGYGGYPESSDDSDDNKPLSELLRVHTWVDGWIGSGEVLSRLVTYSTFEKWLS